MLTSGDLGKLAAAMHESWHAHMTQLGYRHGPERDLELRTHPDLRPFHELSPLAQDRELQVAGALAAAAPQPILPGPETDDDATVEELCLVVYRAWLRSQSHPPDDAPEPSRREWLASTTPQRRAEDAAAVRGFLEQWRVLEAPDRCADPAPAPRPAVAALRRTADPEAGRSGWLRLERNELVPALDAEVFAAVVARLSPETFSAYPALAPLYDDLARHLGVDQAQIVVGAGSDWLVRAAFETFCSPGARVVLAVPTYGMYDVYARMCGADVHRVFHRPDFVLPVEEVTRELSSGARLLGLANPNGAVGSYVPTGLLEPVLVQARKQGTVVVLDEAYVDFVGDSWTRRLEEFPNLLLVRTFSKAAGLAGLRVGYAVGARELVGWVRQVRPNVEINQVGVEACRYLLENPEVVAGHVTRTLAGRALLAERLEALSLEVRQGAANFVHVWFGSATSAVLAALHDARVLVKHHEGDGILDGWTRITAAGPAEAAWVADLVEKTLAHG